MPTSPVQVNYCGTHATGWLNGQHPAKEDGSVSRKVCFHWSGNVCRWNIYIHVRNCGAFYVYHLGRTPGCSFRYCGNNGHGKFSISLMPFLEYLRINCEEVLREQLAHKKPFHRKTGVLWIPSRISSSVVFVKGRHGKTSWSEDENRLRQQTKSSFDAGSRIRELARLMGSVERCLLCPIPVSTR